MSGEIESMETLAEGLYSSVEAFVAKRLLDFDRTLNERFAAIEKALPSLILPALLEQVRALVDAESEKSAKLATFGLREELAAILKEAREASVGILEASNAVSKLPDSLTISASISASVKAAVDALPLQIGPPGTSVTLDDLRPVVKGAVEAAVAAIPVPKDGVVNYDKIETFVTATVAAKETSLIQNIAIEVVGTELLNRLSPAVQEAVAALPPAEKGADAVVDYAQVEAICVTAVAEKFALAPAIIEAQVVKAVEAAVALIPAPEPGKDAKIDEAALHTFCLAHIKTLVDALPPAKDGKSVSLDEVTAAITPAMNLFVREALLQNAPSNAHIKDMVDAAVALLPVPKDGASVTVAEVTEALVSPMEAFIREVVEESAPHAEFIKEMVEAAVAKLPPPKEGKSVTVAELTDALLPSVEATLREMVEDVVPDEGRVKEMLRAAVAQLPPPKDGTSVSMADVTPAITALVAEAVAAKPIPLPDFKALMQETLARERASAPPREPAPAPEIDYKRIISEVQGFLVESVADAVGAIPKPENGAPGKDADPALIAKMVEDAVSAIEIVIPDPVPGKSVDVVEVREMVKGELAQAVLALPKDKPVDFEAIKALVDIAAKQYVSTLPAAPAGKDGLSVKDFHVELLPDERTLRFSLASESQEEAVTKDVVLPVIISRDGYEADKQYARGDSVAWDGSWWVAKRATSEAPGSSDAWKLMAQRGRPGRDREAVVKEGSERVRLK